MAGRAPSPRERVRGDRSNHQWQRGARRVNPLLEDDEELLASTALPCPSSTRGRQSRSRVLDCFSDRRVTLAHQRRPCACPGPSELLQLRGVVGERCVAIRDRSACGPVVADRPQDEREEHRPAAPEKYEHPAFDSRPSMKRGTREQWHREDNRRRRSDGACVRAVDARESRRRPKPTRT